MVTEGEEKPFFSSSSYFMVAIAFQTSIAYAHAGKDRCNFFVVVPFASAGEMAFSEGGIAGMGAGVCILMSGFLFPRYCSS
jgi:hypothetical protein